jgi:hypothetical protein
MAEHTALFNPNPAIKPQRLKNGEVCFVIDDVLQHPERLRQFAIEQAAQFNMAPFNAYPGLEFPMPLSINDSLRDFFNMHMRGLFNARRTLEMNSRMAMVTVPPEQLQARQWICHRDSAWVDPAHCIAASVLYLFDNPNLGGTAFYAPTRPMPEIELFVHDASTMSNEDFAAKYSLPANYFQGAPDYFECIGRIPAKFNRMIFYDGRIFHCGDIHAPESMSPNPVFGRLTLNGFFTCTRKIT